MILALLLLAAEPPPPAPAPAEQARALYATAAKHAQAGNAVAAHAEWVQAFCLDPELPLPPDAPADARAARDEALASLRARLATAAAKATATFTVPLPQSAPLEPAPIALRPAEATPAGETTATASAEAEKPAEKERPYLAGGRLTVGLYGFYVIGENTGGPAPEISFGVNLGPVRLGGAGALLLGNSLAFTLAARVSTTSQSRIAYLAAVDLGLYYGGGNAIFAPFLTAHAVGLRVKTGPVGLEVHALSLSIFYVGTGFRFVPQLGIAVLL